MLARIFVVAVAVNYPWELAQSPLYARPGGWGARVWRCGLASAGDGVMILLIVFTGRLLLRRGDWFVRPDTRGYVVMLAAGLALGIGVEWAAVQGLGWCPMRLGCRSSPRSGSASRASPSCSPCRRASPASRRCARSGRAMCDADATRHYDWHRFAFTLVPPPGRQSGAWPARCTQSSHTIVS